MRDKTEICFDNTVITLQ